MKFSPQNLPSAIFFDFDGTIFDSESLIFQSWQQVFAKHQQVLAVDIYAQCIGSDFNIWSPQQYLEQLTGQQFDWDNINQQRRVFLEREITVKQVIFGVIPFIKLCAEHHIPLAVVSSSSHRWVDSWLAKLNIISYFQYIICRDDVTQIKPNPELYLQAVAKHTFPSQNCLVIEDSANGIQAAKAAGCYACAIPNNITKYSDFQQADAVFQSIRELQNTLFHAKTN